MSFPSGGAGYPQQGGAPGSPQGPSTGGFPAGQYAPPSERKPVSLVLILSLVVTLLALVSYFMSFTEEAKGIQSVGQFLLAGGLIAALRALPNPPKVLPFAAVLSVLGGLFGIVLLIQASNLPTIIILIIVVGILQMLVAVAALLFEANVIKPPQPRPQYNYGSPYGQPGQPGQPGQYGQPGSYGQQSPYGQGQSGPQATTYAPQQGQFFQQPGEQGQPQQPQQGEQHGGMNPQS